MRNIFILFDVPDDNNDKQWLFDGLSKAYPGQVKSVGINKVLSQMIMIKGGLHRLNAYFIILNQCLRTIVKSKKNDIIICWFSTTGKIFNLISKCFGNKRYIISMNWLNPGGRKAGFHYWLAGQCFSNNRCTIAINTPTAPAKWNEYLNSDRHDFLVIPDVYDDTCEFSSAHKKYNGVFFTGGYGNRDWAILMEIAQLCQNNKFICVAQEVDFKSKVNADKLPKNVELFYNTTKEHYYELMKGCSAVLLPIIGNTISGLINIIKAAQLGILCCISKTDSSCQYYAEPNLDLLVDHNVKKWVHEISCLNELKDEQYSSKVKEFQNHIISQFSPEHAISILQAKIDSLIIQSVQDVRDDKK